MQNLYIKYIIDSIKEIKKFYNTYGKVGYVSRKPDKNFTPFIKKFPDFLRIYHPCTKKSKSIE